MGDAVWSIDESLREYLARHASVSISAVDMAGVVRSLTERSDFEGPSAVSASVRCLRFALLDGTVDVPVKDLGGVIGLRNDPSKTNVHTFVLNDRSVFASGPLADLASTDAGFLFCTIAGDLSLEQQHEIDTVSSRIIGLRWSGTSDVSMLAGLTQLTSLNLSGCDRLTDIAAVTGLKQLTSLNLSGCYLLEGIAAVAGLTRLTSLNLSGCTQLNIAAVAGLTQLTQLTSLDLSRCTQLTDIAAVAGLTRLTSLNLSRCKQLKDIAAVAGLTQLTSLNLSGNRRLTDLAAVAGLTQLTSLDLSECSSLTDLAAVAGLTQLTSLNLSECGQLKDIAAVARLTQLVSLSASGCWQLEHIPELASLIHLTLLNLSRCWQLKHISTVARLTQLTSLDLSGCTQLEHFTAVLPNLTRLTSLDLAGCRPLTDIAAVSRLIQLTSLNLSGCGNFTDLTWVNGLTKLTSLNLSGCGQFADIVPLAGLTQIMSLELSACGNVRNLDVLSSCASLRELYWVSEPAAASVLAACSHLAKDVPHIRSKHAEWTSQIALASEPTLLVTRLARALELGVGDDWAADGFEQLIRAARRRPDVGRATWQELFAPIAQYHATTSAERLFTLAISDLDGEPAPSEIVEAALSAMSTLPAACRTWARPLAEVSLAAITSPQDQRAVAPSAALFYRSLGDDARVTRWLEVATDPNASSWRDRVLAALARWDIQNGNVAVARSRLREMQTSGSRDEVLGLLANAIASTSPKEAAAALLSVENLDARAAVATELRGSREFTGANDSIPALLVSLQRDPEQLADLFSQVLAQHPEGAVARAIAGEFSGAQAEGAQHALIRLLQHEVLQRKCDLDDLSPFALELAASPVIADEMLIRGTVATLRARGIIVSEKKASEILVLLLPHSDA